MAIQVRALEKGFHGGRRYRAGDVFILKPGYKPGNWMEVLGEVEPPKAKEPKAKEPAKDPKTYSEMTKILTAKSAKEST